MTIKMNIPVIKCNMCQCEYESYNFLSFGGVSLFLTLKEVSHLAKRKSYKHPPKAEKNLKTEKERNFTNFIYKNEANLKEILLFLEM